MELAKRGRLVLEDGSVFEGYSFGHPVSTAGEIVFNTGMVGYPQSLTDPSYAGQILTFTYPLIGNYGVAAKTLDKHGLLEHFESENIQVKGFIVSEYCTSPYHWNAEKNLGQWLKEEQIPALYGIDTRALTTKIREKGVMLGKIVIDKDPPFYNPNKDNLVAQVSRQEPLTLGSGKHKVIAVDCGMKNNIIRCLLKRDITLKIVPWDYDFTQEDYDGLFLSNGPGDPMMAVKTIEHLKIALTKEKPIFGICLGNQLLALAAGAKTYKLKYGHRSQNQPCVQEGTTRCFITSQNHGFAVDAVTLPAGWEASFTNINDKSNEGIRHKSKPFFSCQFHPEATPGPADTEYLFDVFIKNIEEVKR